MGISGKNVGFAFTGSHCTYEEMWPQVKALVELGANVYPVVSYNVANINTRFGDGADIVRTLETITGRGAIREIVEAEPIGPKKLFDCMIIAPCTGNSLAKLANAITDTPVLMAAKAQLRNEKPLVLAISTNDGLGLNAKNLGVLLNTTNVYFVPFGQDNPEKKPNSLVSDMSLIIPAIEIALDGKQIQPVVIERSRREVK